MQSFIITLLICSVTMSAIALFYMGITPLLSKRYSVTSRYYTWLVVVIGLIIPFRPQFSNAIVKVDIPSNTVVPNIQMGNGTPVTAPLENVLSSTLPTISLWQIAAVVWLAGMIIFLAYHAIMHYHFLKMVVRWSKDIADKQTLTLIENLKAQMGLSKKIGLQFCDSIGSPMLIGFAHPRILLPKADFAKDELCFILKHELVHYKRKDLWYKCLVLIATAIHWFNPIVYLMAKAIDIQCELSCDEKVIRGTSADTRLYYSETIIGVVKYQSKLKTSLSTNFYGGKKGMKKRICSIMDSSKKKAGLSIVCCVLIATMGTGFAFAANAATNMPQEDKKPSYISRTDSLIQSFAKYKPFGVTYNAEQDAVYYNSERVRLFVDFKISKESGMTYAFDLCYQDSNTSSTLYLEAVKDNNGNIVEIRRLDEEIANDLLDEIKADEENKDTDKSDKVNQEVQYITMDATQILEKYGITATDKGLIKDKVADNIKKWIAQCDAKQGIYTLTTESGNKFTTYVYYNGGGRYPWNLSVDNGTIKLNLYSNTGLTATDGYCLISFTAPKDYTNIKLYLDNVELGYEVSNQ